MCWRVGGGWIYKEVRTIIYIYLYTCIYLIYLDRHIYMYKYINVPGPAPGGAAQTRARRHGALGLAGGHSLIGPPAPCCVLDVLVGGGLVYGLCLGWWGVGALFCFVLLGHRVSHTTPSSHLVSAGPESASFCSQRGVRAGPSSPGKDSSHTSCCGVCVCVCVCVCLFVFGVGCRSIG